MTDNYNAKFYRKNKEIKELTNDELIFLGKKYADLALEAATLEGFRPWDFESEISYIINNGLEIGLIRRRKSHIETFEEEVFDED